jgi:hypothetical protein
MTLFPSSLDYSDRDFESLNARVFDLITSVFPTWTADQVHNFGNVLVDSFCFVGDVLNFYQDQQAREGRFEFVQLRRNMQALAKLINYYLPGRQAATADVVLTITNPDQLTGTVSAAITPTILGTRAVTDPVRGEIQGAVTFNIGAGEIEKTFSWEHSITQTPFVVASSGKANQRILAPFGPFLEGTDEVDTPTQGPWVRVDSLYGSGPNDPHYRLLLDQNDRGEFVFGDGKNGVVPVGDITMDYKTGGGPNGNVEAGSLTKLETSFADTEGNTAHVVATNAVDAEGGLGREEVEAARINAPESLRVLTRTVAREDYEINAKRVPAVGRALMLTSNEDVGISENRGKLFIIPATGGDASQVILDAVDNIITVLYPKTVTFQVDVLTAVYLQISVEARIYLRHGVQPSDAKKAVNDALEDFFEPMLANGTENPNVDFGWNYKDVDDNPAGEIAWSDVFNVVRDLTTYIRKVDAGSTGFLLNGLRTDVYIPNWKFPSLGQVTVINGDDGTEI